MKEQELTIRHSKLGHFIALLMVLVLFSIVAWAFYFKDEPLEIDTESSIIILIIGGIGSIVLFFILKILILNPAVIVINKNGFEYNPGGISSGWIPWSNVEEIKYLNVRTAPPNADGKNLETALAIKLKDNSSYVNQYNFVLKNLMKINYSMYKMDILFRLSSFGKRHEEVYALMNKHWEAKKDIEL